MPTLTFARKIANSNDRISDQEWRIRRDLAAMYRLVALEGWDDLIFTHLSARLPGTDGHFLMNPMQLCFDEITASSLIEVDAEGNLVRSTDEDELNAAGYVIHSAIHAARPDVHFVVHLHTLDGMAVSSQSPGLLPLGQTALGVIPRLAHHDYEGVALNLDERERLVRDLGDKNLMLLRNHGTLAVGASAGETWLGIYALERACSVQIRALSAGQADVCEAPQAAQMKVAELVRENKGQQIYDMAWAALLRRVQRLSPGFDA